MPARHERQRLRIHQADPGCPKWRAHCYRDLLVSDLAGVAGLAGVPLCQMFHADELGIAMMPALDVASPALIDVDVASIGAMPSYFPYDQNPKRAA